MIELSQRTIEVAIRWSEIHCMKLFDYIHEDHRLDELTCYVFEKDDLMVDIHTMKENRFDTDYRVRVIAYIAPYKHDKLFSVIFTNRHQLHTLRGHFTPHIGTKPTCHCGRLSQHHVLESENGKCNNCYIYGMIRGEECAICKEDDGKPWVKTSCGHYFHDSCWYHIEENIDDIRKCPLCRSEQTKRTIEKI